MKKGDIVKVISLDKVSYETSNWFSKEKPTVKIGDEYKVLEVHDGDGKNLKSWIDLEGLEYAHPAEKFEFVRQPDRFKHIATVQVYDPDGNLQEVLIYWDNERNAPFGLDASFIEQLDFFHYPYDEELIRFDDYPETF